jgi:hypothetical protein
MARQSPKASGTPIAFLPAGAGTRLEKINLGLGHHDEAWLQALAFEHPQVLPMMDIEPGLGELVAVAREIPCGHGYIDNLYVTGAGDLVLVEAKLWRNAQSRREVVGQALDYVAALMGMGIEAFETSCRRGQGMGARTLHALVSERGDALDEAAFLDAVSRNLAQGRLVVVVLGDGIRSETEALAELLQSHAGAHFTFALVECALWRSPATGEILVIPSTLLRTAMITRGVVAIEQGVPTIRPVAPDVPTEPRTISEEIFYEHLAARDPLLPQTVKDFVASLEPLGIYPEFKASLNLKADLPGAPRATNFGYITRHGKLWTDTLAWTAPAAVALAYNEQLAGLARCTIAMTSSGSPYISTNGSSAPLVTVLLPDQAAAWKEAIEQASEAIRKAYAQAEVEG